VGGAPLRYLLEFFALTPTIDTLHQTIASGDNESIRMVWDRVDTRAALTSRPELAKTAAEFHFVGIVNWLLKDALRWMRKRVREFAVGHRLFDVVLGMASLPPDDEEQPFKDSMAADYGDQLLEWLPGVTNAKLLAKREGRDAASVKAFIDAAVGHARTVTFIETENRKSICGCFIGPAWPSDGGVRDWHFCSFLFTLENHLGVAPTKFPKCKDGGLAASVVRHGAVVFGCHGCMIAPTDIPERVPLGERYQDLIGGGSAIFRVPLS
jgi:hypothetical protein